MQCEDGEDYTNVARPEFAFIAHGPLPIVESA